MASRLAANERTSSMASRLAAKVRHQTPAPSAISFRAVLACTRLAECRYNFFPTRRARACNLRRRAFNCLTRARSHSWSLPSASGSPGQRLKGQIDVAEEPGRSYNAFKSTRIRRARKACQPLSHISERRPPGDRPAQPPVGSLEDDPRLALTLNAGLFQRFSIAGGAYSCGMAVAVAQSPFLWRDVSTHCRLNMPARPPLPEYS